MTMTTATQRVTHTPGPWTADDDGAIWGPQHERSRYKNGRQRIGCVVDEKGAWSPFLDNGVKDAEAMANARLIMAAPDLARACEAALAQIADDFGLRTDEDWIDDVDDERGHRQLAQALAAALGRAGVL